MTMLIIVLIIIVFFILVGMIKLNVNFSFCEGKKLDCILKILFFKIDLLAFDRERKKAKTKKFGMRKVNSEKNGKDDKKSSLKKGQDGEKRFIDVLTNVKMFVEPLPKFLRKLARRVKIEQLSVVWCISTNDACETALKYARCCGYFYNIFRMVSSICKVKAKKIRIFPDFINEKSYCIVFLRLQISTGRLFILILGYLMAIIIKYLNKNKKERLK